MIGKWNVVIEKNILKVCVVLAFCCMVLLQNNVYGATTENGSRSNPYLVQTESKLKNIFSNNKKTSVVYIAIVGIVTHNLAQAKRIADQVIFMDQGEVLEVTEKEKFFENPASEPAKEQIQYM